MNDMIFFEISPKGIKKDQKNYFIKRDDCKAIIYLDV